LESEMRKSKRSRSSCNKPRRPRSISPPPGTNTSLLLTPRRRKSMELPLPKKRKTTGGNSVVLPATASENYNSNNKTPRNILTAKSGPASSTMKNSKDTQTDPIGGPSVPAAGCVKPYPTKQFMIKSRDLSRPSIPKIKHHLCVNSYTGPDYQDPIRNLKIGSGKPQKILLTKNRRELRVITNIRRSYSQQSLTVYNIPDKLAGTLPSNHHSSRTRYIPKTRHSLESSISPLQENPPNKFLQQTDTNNNLKSMEKLIVLRKRSKISTTTGENSFMDELKENCFQNNNNLGHSLISEKRIYSQRGHIEKKICIKNDKRMTWIL